MAKPRPTIADYFVIALSPALIMALVGSLCYFLIDVRYQGKMGGSLCWMMFWFVLAAVLVTRIAINDGGDRAAIFGLGLGVAVWLYLLQNSPAYLFSIVLMAVIWYCTHKLVCDCTLIDEDEDSSGCGLMTTSKPEPAPDKPKPVKKSGGKTVKRRKVSQSPGRSVIWFSVAALPLFGLGQVILPTGADGGRRLGFALLVVYLGAALGLLVTTSFLGLRRYLRQRYLPMPVSIAFAWVKFGVGVAMLILIAATFVPRPGAAEAWTNLRAQVDDRLRQISRYASPAQPGDTNQSQSNVYTNSSDSNSQTPDSSQSSQAAPPPSGPTPPATPPPLPGQAADVYKMLRNTMMAIAALVVGFVLYRCRHLLAEVIRSLIEAFRRWLLLSIPVFHPTGPAAPERRRRPLSEFKNPFYSDPEHSREASEIILYTYEALQAWAIEQGIEPHPERTPREFCQEMTGHLPDLSSAMRHLAYLHAHAAYGRTLPANCDMEPLKEIWRRLTWNAA